MPFLSTAARRAWYQYCGRLLLLTVARECAFPVQIKSVESLREGPSLNYSGAIDSHDADYQHQRRHANSSLVPIMQQIYEHRMPERMNMGQVVQPTGCTSTSLGTNEGGQIRNGSRSNSINSGVADVAMRSRSGVSSYELGNGLCMDGLRYGDVPRQSERRWLRPNMIGGGNLNGASRPVDAFQLDSVHLRNRMQSS